MLRSRSISVSVGVVALAAGNARAQLPAGGAPLAEPGPDEVVSGFAFGSPGLIVFRPADLDAMPQTDTLPVRAWGNGSRAKAGDDDRGSDDRSHLTDSYAWPTTVVKGEHLGPPVIILCSDDVVRVQVPPAALCAALIARRQDRARSARGYREESPQSVIACIGEACGG